jgi:O-antigen biosynthesis protein
MSKQPPADKLAKKIHLLESELTAIKTSRSYRVAKAGGVFRTKLRDDPVGLSKKLLKTIFSNPRRIVRLAKGGETNTGVGATISNRVANYHAWIALCEPNTEELANQRVASQKFDYKPVISVLTPVFDPPIGVLRELIESVLNQTYPYFELCLGNFGRSDMVKRLLDEYAKQDSRVKVYEFKENLGISGNSNLILDKVEGEFVALLDHDDTLSPDALYENVKLLNEGEYDFIYSDKDMIDEEGNRYEPLFKADFSPETMLNANYLTHLNVMRTSVVKGVDAWDSKADGAQDWDLFLKIMNATDKFAHIPKVFYHWRVIETSTAHSIETKPYALAGQRYAVQKYLDSQGFKAKPYHKQTELLLEWDDSVIDDSPRLLVHFHTVTDTVQLLSRLKKLLPEKSVITVLTAVHISGSDERVLRRHGVREFVQYDQNQFASHLKDVLQQYRDSHASFLFADDRIRIPRSFSYRDFMGWLSMPEVGVVGVKVTDQEDLVVDCGAVLTSSGLAPIFHGNPAYYQSIFGNSEWVRDLHVVSRGFFGFTREALQGIQFNPNWSDEAATAGLMLQISKKHRLVSTPKAAVIADQNPYADFDQASILADVKDILDAQPVKGVDKYGNPNLHPQDPMKFSTDQIEDEASSVMDTLDQYQNDALILTQTFDLSAEEIQQNIALSKQQKPINPKSVGWFLPSFDAIYAGLNNIFSFADHLANQGLKTTFFILTNGDAETEKQLVTAKFPGLKKAIFVPITPNTIDKVPPLDIGICTQWATAYPLAKVPHVKRKCYFIQDNEPNFYPMGSVSALADLTYRLGFFAIANTNGLLEMYKNKYGGHGTVLKSLVYLDAYHPREDKYYKPTKPYQVFFYARPNMPRNAFELGLAGLKALKAKLGSDVRIVAAGAAWDPETYGVAGVVENLGKIPYESVPNLYRSMDAGVMFMFSGHPGVTASELMASGCPTVVNEYDDATWNDLYQHEKTCLVSTPTASEIARNIQRCLENSELRRTLIDGGLKKVHEFYKGYEQSQTTTFEAIKKGK